MTTKQKWAEAVNRVWDANTVPTWQDMYCVYQEHIQCADTIAATANIANLTDLEVAQLRTMLASMRELLDDFKAVHEYADAFEERVVQPPSAFDTTTWYAAWTAGWNAQREGKSMAECAPAFERFKSGLDRDPLMDDDEYTDDEYTSPDPHGVFEEVLVGNLPVPENKIRFISTDCHGDLPSEGISPSDYFKIKNENELLRRRLAKYEGAIQQLCEDMK